jgi:putative endonuclease
MSFFVYILKCSDGSYYTGHTDNLEKRIAQHEGKEIPTCYTATRLPLELVFVQQVASRIEALASERQIKGWSRKKKEAMILGDWNEVSRLAQNALRRAQGERSVTSEPVARQALHDRKSSPVRDEPASPVLVSSGRGEPVSSVRGEPASPVLVSSVRGEPVSSVRGEPVSSVRGEPVEPRTVNKNTKV